MNTGDLRDLDTGTPFCRKRLWVLTTLSDDEFLGDGETLPRGLQFHLSQCPACRSLADRLLAVRSSLCEMGAFEPSADLSDRAQTQAIAALRSGAKLTGRVTILDEPEASVGAGSRSADAVSGLSRPTRRWVYARFAAAAAIVVAATIAGVSRWPGPDRQALVDRERSWDARPVSSATAPDPEDDAERVGDRASATSVAAGPNAREMSRRPPFPVRRYSSHYEAALSDAPGGFQAAFPLPRPAARGAGWTALFDKPTPIESTTPLQP